MPSRIGYIAKRLCPELLIVRPRYDAYKTASQQVQAVMAEYDPEYRMMSLDEAYLNLDAYLQVGCLFF